MAIPERRPFGRAAMLGIGALMACGATVLAFRQMSRGNAARDQYERFLHEPPAEAAVDAEVEVRIRTFCGDCHAVPRPESFHRDAWHEEVRRGYEFYAKSGRTDLDPPPIRATTAYFRSRAPERLVYPQPVEAKNPPAVAFKRERLGLEPDAQFPPAISQLCWTRLAPDESPVLLASDMRNGAIVSLDLLRGDRKPRPLARLDNPCRMEPCDLDGTQNIGLLVSDLGSFSASDHDRGQVVWLRRDKGKDAFEKVVIARGLGRVADVRVADFDGDGRPDLLVAEFGTNGDAFDNKYLSPWHGVQWLENLGDVRFKYHRLTDMPGACRAAVGDFKGDGKLEIVVTSWLPDQFNPDTLKATTLPSIVLLEQTSPGHFDRHTLEAGFPHYAAIAAGDFNGDGGLDFVVGVQAGNAAGAEHWLEIWWNGGKPAGRPLP